MNISPPMIDLPPPLVASYERPVYTATIFAAILGAAFTLDRYIYKMPVPVNGYGYFVPEICINACLCIYSNYCIVFPQKTIVYPNKQKRYDQTCKYIPGWISLSK